MDTVRAGRRKKRSFTAEQVISSAGTYNTQKLLHKLRDTGTLPHVSQRLGALTRTNSESILGAKSRTARNDYTRGVAITSSFHPDEHTHIEPVRYGKGSNVMGLLQTTLTDAPRGVRGLIQNASESTSCPRNGVTLTRPSGYSRPPACAALHLLHEGDVDAAEAMLEDLIIRAANTPAVADWRLRHAGTLAGQSKTPGVGAGGVWPSRVDRLFGWTPRPAAPDPS